MTCDSWHQNRISPVTSSYRVNMGHKKLLRQFAIIALIICSSCGVRRYKYGSRIRSLAERRNYRQPKDFYSVNNIPRYNYKMKNIYEQGKSKYYKYSKRFRWVRIICQKWQIDYSSIWISFRKPSDDSFHVPELKTTTSTTTPSSPATTKTSVSFATSISTSVSTSYKYSIQDHKKRLRKLLVPLPRHIAGAWTVNIIGSPMVWTTSDLVLWVWWELGRPQKLNLICSWHNIIQILPLKFLYLSQLSSRSRNIIYFCWL